VGQKAVQIAVEEGSGLMSTILRGGGADLLCPLRQGASGTGCPVGAQLPHGLVGARRLDVTDDFVRYARR